MKISLLLVFVAFSVSFPVQAANSVPKVLNYQARLTDSGGVQVPDGALSIIFKLYDGDGNCLYSARGTCGTPTAKSVTVTGGVFTTHIGEAADNEIPDGLFDNNVVTLGITIGADAEMTPRKRLTAAAYALNADRLDDLDVTSSGSTTAYIPSTTANGNLVITGDPQGSGVGNGSLYVNPSNPAASETLFGVASNGSTRFQIDKEGDIAHTGSLLATAASSTAQFVFRGAASQSTNIFEVQDSGTNRLLSVSATSIAIMTSSPSAILDVRQASGNTGRLFWAGPAYATFSADVRTDYFDITNSVIGYHNNLEASAGVYNGLAVVAENNVTTDTSGFQAFEAHSISSHASGNKSVVGTGFFQTYHIGAGTISSMTDLAIYPRSKAGSGTITDSTGLYISPALEGTTTSLYRLRIAEGDSTGVTTNSYGLYLDEMVGNGDVLNYSIYSNNPSYPFVLEAGGNVGIGSAFPNARLSVSSGATPTLNIFEITNALGTGAYTTKYFTVSSTSTLVNTAPTQTSGYKFSIGNAAPANMLTVGSATSTFEVNSAGNLVKINNIPYSWPSSQGAASTVLQNNGSGTLSWTLASGLGNLNQAYLSSTSTGAYAEISITPSLGAVTIADTFSGSGTIFEIQDRTNATGDYSRRHFSVSSTSTQITGGSRLIVGATNTMVVNSSGNFEMINGVTTRFPSAQGSSGQLLTNDGAGNLSWTTVSAGSTNLNQAYLSSTSTGAFAEIYITPSLGAVTIADTLSGTGNVFEIQNRTTAAGSYSQRYFTVSATTVAIGPGLNTASNPSFSFIDDPDTGFYQNVGGAIAFTNDGSTSMVIEPTGNVVIFNSGTLTVNGGTIDIGASSGSLADTPTTLTLANAATSLTIGGTTGRTTVRNAAFAVASSFTTSTTSTLINSGAGGSYLTGINTRLPSAALTVADSRRVPTNNIFEVQNTSGAGSGGWTSRYFTVSSTNVSMMDGSMTVSATGTVTLNIPLSSGNFALCHNSNGVSTNQMIVDCANTPAADYMEMYPAAEDAWIGHIVMPGTTYVETPNSGLVPQVVRTTSAYEGSMIGVISNPDDATDFNSIGHEIDPSDNPRPVALKGRVKVRVNMENGPIEVGDPITSSSVAGIGMKSTKPGMIVGQALTAWSGPGEGVVLVFMGNGYHSGMAITTDGVKSLFADDFTFKPLTVSSATATSFSSYALNFGASAWDASQSAAVTRNISLRNDITDKDTYQLTFKNEVGGTLAALNQSGDLAIAGSLTINGGFDYAETFPATPDLDAGDIVMVDAENTNGYGVKKSDAAYENTLLGVISTKPGFLTGKSSAGTQPVALAGRVPVKVNTESGEIKPGDPITSSSTPGVGMKATEAGRVIGIALEGWSGAGEAMITVFVNPSWWNGPASLAGAAAGSALTISGETLIDFKNSTLANVSAIVSTSGLWSVTSDGILAAQKVETKSVQTENVVLVQSETAASVSEGKVPSGYNATVVHNPSMTSNAKVFVSFLGDPGGGYWIGEKGEGNFTLHLAQPAIQDLPFEYWILGVDDRRPDPPIGTDESTPPSNGSSPIDTDTTVSASGTEDTSSVPSGTGSGSTEPPATESSTNTSENG